MMSFATPPDTGFSQPLTLATLGSVLVYLAFVLVPLVGRIDTVPSVSRYAAACGHCVHVEDILSLHSEGWKEHST